MLSALYPGWVMHRRLTPRPHRFAYRVFAMLVDLDELPKLDRTLKLFGWNRFGLLSFQDKDHSDGRPLKVWLDALLADAGIEAHGTRQVLCYPRILGYVFNPLSVWFCHDQTGTLKAVIYEVHNTYDERHAYVLPVEGSDNREHRPRVRSDSVRTRPPTFDAAALPTLPLGNPVRTCDQKIVRHGCAKNFYVSPFLSRDCRYQFRIHPPGDRVAISIQEEEAGQPILNASFAGKRRALSDSALLAMLLRYPLMTLKVVAAIHFEAVRLMLKGVRRHPHAPKADYARPSPAE